MEEISHSHDLINMYTHHNIESLTMMLPGQQESQMSNRCEFGHQVFPLTLIEQPEQKLRNKAPFSHFMTCLIGIKTHEEKWILATGCKNK